MSADLLQVVYDQLCEEWGSDWGAWGRYWRSQGPSDGYPAWGQFQYAAPTPTAERLPEPEPAETAAERTSL